MKFKSYVVNLKKDKDRWININNNFTNTGINIYRFNAIYGKTDKYKYYDYLTPFCKMYGTDFIIGCGLSHILLAKYIYENDLNDTFKFALIMEDDMKPIDKTKIYDQIIDTFTTINKIDPEWEIIRLHCFGLCGYNNNNYNINSYSFSNGSYLISKYGIIKLMNLKLNYHLDTQIHKTFKRIYKSKEILFINNGENDSNNVTYIIKTHIRLNNYSPSIDYFLHAPFIKLFSTELKTFNIIVIFGLLLFLINEKYLIYYFIILTVIIIYFKILFYYYR